MKRLTPAMEDKTRYLRFQIHSETDVDLSAFVNEFWSSATNFLGSKELSAAQPWIIANKFDEEQHQGVIRVNRDYETEIRALLTLISSFENVKGFVEIKKVSGSIRGVS